MPSIVDQRIRSEKVRRCVNNSLRYLSMNMYIRPHHCQNSLPLYQFHDAFRHVIGGKPLLPEKKSNMLSRASPGHNLCDRRIPFEQNAGKFGHSGRISQYGVMYSQVPPPPCTSDYLMWWCGHAILVRHLSILQISTNSFCMLSLLKWMPSL